MQRAPDPILNQRHQALRLGLGDTLAILWPYARDNFLDQVRAIWFIVVYLVLFQILVLGLPIVFAAMIGAGIVIDLSTTSPQMTATGAARLSAYFICLAKFAPPR